MVSGNEDKFSPSPFCRRGLVVLCAQTWNGKPSTVPDCSVVAACHIPGKDVLEEISSCLPLLLSFLMEQLHNSGVFIGVERVKLWCDISCRWCLGDISLEHGLS